MLRLFVCRRGRANLQRELRRRLLRGFLPDLKGSELPTHKEATVWSKPCVGVLSISGNVHSRALKGSDVLLVSL